MGHNESIGPVRQRRHFRPEQLGTADHRTRRFGGSRPPDLVERRKIMIGPGLGQLGAGRADVACEREAFPHSGVDEHRDSEHRGYWSRRLERARVRRCNDPRNPLVSQRLRCLLRLKSAQFSQARISDAGILPGLREMEIEFALTVPQENHGGWG